MATIDEIRAIEEELMRLRHRLAELRKGASEAVEDYTLEEWNGPVRLSELFGDKTELLVIHNMGAGCPYCTLWADGFTGLQAHIEDRVSLVMVTPDPIDKQMKFAESRGWHFRMLSDPDREFSSAMGYWKPESNMAWPGVSAFAKAEDGTVTRTGRADFGENDEFCAVWPMFGLLRDGVNGWAPKYRYEVARRPVLI